MHPCQYIGHLLLTMAALSPPQMDIKEALSRNKMMLRVTISKFETVTVSLG
jgi:hypothetical protein